MLDAMAILKRKIEIKIKMEVEDAVSNFLLTFKVS